MDLSTLVEPSAMRSAGLMASELIAAEPWRAVTALTLHADHSHLAANAAALGAFGLMLSRRTGLGVTVFVAVAGGALGNALNAWVLAPSSHWVGASTAVFAVLGAACAAFRSALMLVAAIAFVVLSHAANVDSGAHALGLFAGLMMGLALRSDDDEPKGAGIQLSAASATVAAVAACWSLALG